jgi:hypothetical protein
MILGHLTIIRPAASRAAKQWTAGLVFSLAATTAFINMMRTHPLANVAEWSLPAR